MAGPCAQLKTLALTLWSVEKLIQQQNPESRVQEAKRPVRTLLENPSMRRLGYTGGAGLGTGGQFPLVISFKAVNLFVVSGAGFTLPNFNTETSDSKLSGRFVPIIKAFAMILC